MTSNLCSLPQHCRQINLLDAGGSRQRQHTANHAQQIRQRYRLATHQRIIGQIFQHFRRTDIAWINHRDADALRSQILPITAYVRTRVQPLGPNWEQVRVGCKAFLEGGSVR